MLVSYSNYSIYDLCIGQSFHAWGWRVAWLVSHSDQSQQSVTFGDVPRKFSINTNDEQPTVSGDSSQYILFGTDRWLNCGFKLDNRALGSKLRSRSKYPRYSKGYARSLCLCKLSSIQYQNGIHLYTQRSSPFSRTCQIPWIRSECCARLYVCTGWPPLTSRTILIK